MYVLVLRSVFTGEIFGVLKNFSDQPCRFDDFAVAERTAHEKNSSEQFVGFYEEGVRWVVKKDDGIYLDVKSSLV